MVCIRVIISFFCFILIILLPTHSWGQRIEREIGLSTGFSSNESLPFWSYANRQGDLPMKGFSTSVLGKIQKKYRFQDSIVWKGDYSFSFDGRLRVGDKVDLRLIEAKFAAKFGAFEFVGGREREYSQMLDSNLTIGSFSLSGNSLGIPKVELRIPDYYHIPFTNKVLAIKGRIIHGWMGDVPIHYGDNRGSEVSTYYHHLSFFGQLGRPTWRLKLEAGLTHDVIWGSDQFIFGEQYDLSDWEAFKYVVTGKAYGGAKGYSGRLDISKIGNHSGTLNLAGSYDFDAFGLNIYRQFFYEKGALRYLANIKDGLTGIKYVNKRKPIRRFFLNKVVLEHFYSKDQGGQFGAPWTPSGPEYYYNHGVYAEGFSYKQLGLGNPLITPAYLAKEGLALNPKDYFISTRVSALHLGMTARYDDFLFSTKLTFAQHFGDYHTSGPSEQWFNGKKIPQEFNYGTFTPVDQFSYFFEVSKSIKSSYTVSGALVGDQGSLFKNTLGTYVTLKKSWN